MTKKEISFLCLIVQVVVVGSTFCSLKAETFLTVIAERCYCQTVAEARNTAK